MIIKRIYLKNFQSHSETSLELSPNFTCIIGPSNSGKTAIVNALAFLFFNEWDSDYIRVSKDSDGKCCVEVEFDDGSSVVRVKSKSINKIEFKENGKIVKTYSNFGSEYPDEVKNKFTGMIDGLHVCLAKQDNNSFLINESPSVKGRIISHLSGVNILDDLSSRIVSKLRELSDKKKLAQEKLKMLESNFSRYEHIDKAESLIKKYEKLCEKQVSWEKQLSDTIALNDRLKQVNKEIQVYVTELNKYNVDFSYLFDSLSEDTEISEKIKNLRETNDEIRMLSDQYEKTSNDIIDVVKRLGTLIKESGVCPLCGSEFSSDSVDYIFQGPINE